MKLCIHKWNYIEDIFPDTFLGEDIVKSYVRFRICNKCGNAQEQCSTISEIGYWRTLDENEVRILKEK